MYGVSNPFYPELKGEDGWSEAYDVCRQLNVPIVVKHDNELTKIYPSGHFTVIRHTSEIHVIDVKERQ